MDLLRDNVRAVYRKYFLAAFGGALISCIYGVVDMAMVGQYQGPDGTAVMAWAGVWLLEEPILRFFGADALAIYGPVINISTFVQCCAYSVGQAAQPIISTNSGAHQGARIRAVLRLALVSCVAFSVFWTALSLAWPNLYIRIFMRPTAAILTMAPGIVRTYAVSFLLLPLNIFSTYYFQAILKPGAAFFVSVARGLVISGALILLLPAVLGPASIWWAMPVTERLCRGGHAARDAGAAAVLKPGLSAYTPVIGGDVHEALEGLFVRGSVSAADGGEDGRPGSGNGRA